MRLNSASFFPALTLALCAAAVKNTVYLIRNAETPSLGLPGLTLVGQQRSENCLPALFGAGSAFDIGFIIACKPNLKSGVCVPAVNTATPLANSLGLPINATCGTEDTVSDSCVTDLMKGFAKMSNQSILLVWDENFWDDLTEDISIDDTPDFPDGNYDVIWEIAGPKVTAQLSQNCSGIDPVAPGTETLPT